MSDDRETEALAEIRRAAEDLECGVMSWELPEYPSSDRRYPQTRAEAAGWRKALAMVARTGGGWNRG